MLKTFEKREVSSAKILNIEINPSGRSFVWIKNNSGPNTDPSETPVFFFSTQMFVQLKQRFVHDFEDSFQVKKIVHIQYPMRLT